MKILSNFLSTFNLSDWREAIHSLVKCHSLHNCLEGLEQRNRYSNKFRFHTFQKLRLHLLRQIETVFSKKRYLEHDTDRSNLSRIIWAYFSGNKRMNKRPRRWYSLSRNREEKSLRKGIRKKPKKFTQCN